MLASKTIAAHIMRGVIAAALIAWALLHQSSDPAFAVRRRRGGRGRHERLPSLLHDGPFGNDRREDQGSMRQRVMCHELLHA
ncbi:MAG: hypothetical protein AUH43_23255 [Acidobacteria bacterium 13_1_40CM_65_14]|nr:MAG: hypothetical protein AUH43_23255 [Acidobacteria bacterium 13_1_40CM_65_14]